MQRGRGTHQCATQAKLEENRGRRNQAARQKDMGRVGRSWLEEQEGQAWEWLRYMLPRRTEPLSSRSHVAIRVRHAGGSGAQRTMARILARMPPSSRVRPSMYAALVKGQGEAKSFRQRFNLVRHRFKLLRLPMTDWLAGKLGRGDPTKSTVHPGFWSRRQRWLRCLSGCATSPGGQRPSWDPDSDKKSALPCSFQCLPDSDRWFERPGPRLPS